MGPFGATSLITQFYPYHPSMLISATDLVYKSVTLYKNNWKLFSKYALLYLIPGLLTSAARAFLVPETLLGQPPIVDQGFYWYLLIRAVIYIMIIWITVAFVQVIKGKYEETTIASTLTAQLQEGKELLGPVVVAKIYSGVLAFIVGALLLIPATHLMLQLAAAMNAGVTGLPILGTLLGLILLSIPGIIVLIWFTFVLYEVVFNNQRGMKSLISSKNIFKKRLWAIVWRLSLVYILYFIARDIVVGILAFPLPASETNLLAGIGVALITTVIGILFAPYLYTATTLLYLSLLKDSSKK